MALNRLADEQFGLLRYDDLVALGLSRNEIAGRLRRGRLSRIHHKVYALGHTALRPEARWLAAIWATAPHGTLSHVSAAAYHHMYDEPADTPLHVTTPRQAKTRPGLVVHRVRVLDPRDVFRPHPLRVTSIPRTVVDMADVLSWHEYRGAIDNLPTLHLKAVQDAQRRAPNRRGAPLVTRLIEADRAHTRSEFERRFQRFVGTHDLPRPDDLNIRVAGHQADCFYANARLVIELDGRAFHRRRKQLRTDREKDIDYQLDRVKIMRLVWDDLHRQSASRTVDRITRMLALGA